MAITEAKNKSSLMTITYIGLGSNLDNPEQQIRSALVALNKIKSSKLQVSSSLYRSKPIGPQDQDDFINAVAEIETELDAIELLDELQKIEKLHRRKRIIHWGPRTLDLDILMYGDEEICNDRLTIPHKEMLNRAFVLFPLSEINPDCVIPNAGPISTLLNNFNTDDLVKLS